MAWLSVSFEVSAPDLEALTDALLAAGALAVDVEDADAGSDRERPLYAEGVVEPRPWARNVVRALLAGDAQPGAVLAAACAAAGIETPGWRSEPVAEQDWVRLTQAQFGPIRISPRLWVVPSWVEPPDRSAVTVVLDPGVAFGTGNHATTRLCLSWLAARITGGESLVDYGCGSGILAIAALKLGAARATGIDIDPQALVAARANAVQNQVNADFRAADAPRPAACDIVMANILAHPLIVLAPALAALTAPRGQVVLSGILEQQAAEVQGAYAAWFDLEVQAELEQWVLLAGVRR